MLSASPWVAALDYDDVQSDQVQTQETLRPLASVADDGSTLTAGTEKVDFSTSVLEKT